MTKYLKTYGPYLVFLAAMLWASDAPFRVYLTETLSSNFIVLAEHFISVIILLPLVFIHRNEFKKLSWKEWLAVLFIGIGGSALALVAFTESFSYMNPSVAILLQKLQPLIAIALAGVVLQEKTGKKFWLWTVIALVGAYIISFPNLIPQVYEGEVFSPHVIGMLLALAGAVLWGASTVFGRYALNRISFKALTSLRFVIAFIFLLIWNSAQGSLAQLGHTTPKDWLFLAIIAITSGVVSLFIYYKGLSHSKASIATIAELGFPLAAVVVNYIFLDATLSTNQLLGMIVLFLAVLQLGKVNKQEQG